MRILCLVIFVSLGFAQESPDKLAATANAAYQAKDWAKAEPLYEQLARAQPANPRAWYRLGVCLQSVGEHQKALDAFQQAQAKGTPVYIVGYNITAVLTSMGQTAKALDELAETIKQGYSGLDRLTNDPDLQPLRGDARFAALVEETKKNQTPCDYSVESRQFDFWVGDWAVVATADGAPAGTSHIERTIGDCVIWENWTSLGSGYFGKSYNIYNAALKRWEQFWVDNSGAMIHFYGNLNNGVMDFYTDDVPQPDGSKLRRHLQFFNLNPKTVRQFSQGSKDGGKTWAVEYDFTYNRTK